MKASELIAALQEIIDEHGDLPVYEKREGDAYKIDAPEYHEAQEWTPLPERIEI